MTFREHLKEQDDKTWSLINGDTLKEGDKIVYEKGYGYDDMTSGILNFKRATEDMPGVIKKIAKPPSYSGNNVGIWVTFDNGVYAKIDGNGTQGIKKV